jgi:hypothetical protein
MSLDIHAISDRVSKLEQVQLNMATEQAEIKKNIKEILHDVKQSSQDSKEVSKAVEEFRAEFENVFRFIMPNPEVGHNGIFQQINFINDRVGKMEDKVNKYEAQLSIVKWVSGCVWSVVLLFIAYYIKNN